MAILSDKSQEAAQAAAGDLLLLHHRKHMYILHSSLVHQLCISRQNGSAASYQQCSERSLAFSFQTWRTYTDHIAYTKQQISVEISLTRATICSLSYNTEVVLDHLLMHQQTAKQLLPKGYHSDDSNQPTGTTFSKTFSRHTNL